MCVLGGRLWPARVVGSVSLGIGVCVWRGLMGQTSVSDMVYSEHATGVEFF